MKRATRDMQWLTGPNGEFLGVALGWDFCPDHQSGIRYLRQAFGLPAGPDRGMDTRKITALPSTLAYSSYLRTPRYLGRHTVPARKEGQATVCGILIGHARWRGNDVEALGEAKELVDFRTEPGDRHFDPAHSNISAAWDDESFAVLTRGEENCAKLQTLHDAFHRLDIVIGTGQDFGFVRSLGLSFVIASRVSEADRAQVLANDLEYIRFREAADATGIESLLAAAGKRWSTLRPGWADAGQSEVRFFLHPLQQSRYRSGWFSVADLEAWARDEGPVLVRRSA